MATDEAKSPETFDEDCVESMKLTAMAMMKKHPELRACIVVWDYHKGLNDSQAKSAFWMGPNGPPQTPAEIAGGLTQLTRMMERMFKYTVSSIQGLNEDMEAGVQAVLDKSKEHDELLCKIEEAKAKLEKLNVQIGEADGETQAETPEAEKDSGEQPKS